MALTKEEIRKLYGKSDPKKMSFFNKIKMLFLHPAHFFEGVKSENLKPAIVMFLAILILTQVIGAIGLVLVSPLALISIILLPINIGVGLILMIIIFLWVHLFVRLLGGKKGLNQTLKALMYASVPPTIVSTILGLITSLILGFSSFLRPEEILLNPSTILSLGILVMSIFIISIWQLYLSGLGVGKLHSISTGRGIMAIIIAVLIPLIIISMIGFFYIFYSFVGPVTSAAAG